MALYQLLLALIALLPLSALSTITSLPPALGGRFEGDNVLSFTSLVPNGNLSCRSVYYGVTSSRLESPQVGIAFGSNCTINGTVDPNVEVPPGMLVVGNELRFGYVGNLSTVACGLQFQVGMAYGVMGGMFYSTLEGLAFPAFPMCVYYTRVSAEPKGFAKLSLSLRPGVEQGNKVACPENPGNWSTSWVNLPDLECAGEAFQRFNCVNSPQSRCLDDNKGKNNIGIGMSVGGIGLLLVTLGCILIIQKTSKQ